MITKANNDVSYTRTEEAFAAKFADGGSAVERGDFTSSDLGVTCFLQCTLDHLLLRALRFGSP